MKTTNTHTMDGLSENTVFNQWHNGKRHGEGSFAIAIFEAYIKASGNNREKLQTAFPEFFTTEV